MLNALPEEQGATSAQTQSDASAANVKTAEAATDQTNSESQSLIATLEAIGASQAMIEFETDGTIITANPNFLSALGYQLSEIVGKHHSIFVKPGYKESAEYQQFWNNLRSGTFQAGEFMRISKDGREVWIQAAYNPVIDASGKVTKVVKNAVDITEQKLVALKNEAETAQLFQMLDQLPINVLAADPKTVTITYANKTSIDTLRGLQNLLPIPVDDLVGTCIDVFHKDPSVQRRILSDPANLPYATNITLGDDTLSLKVSPIRDAGGNYILALLVWEVVTTNVAIAQSTRTVADAVATSAGEMQAASSQLSGNINDTRTRLTTVAAAAEQASTNVNAVASAAEELASTTGEISRQVNESNRVTDEAALEVKKAGELVNTLDEAGQKIGAVVSLINDIASQTNLLALNATIEAARAGEAGKGFAVVASEVKALAQQTAGATEEITGQIETMQEATQRVVDAIKDISTTIATVNETATAISAAVEEQSAATQEIAENAQQVAAGTSEVSKNTQSVESAMEEAAQGVTRMEGESEQLLTRSEELNVEIGNMLKQIGMDDIDS